MPQALGADEFLRVTWHPGRDVIVFSHWQGAECVAATPVRVTDLDELATLLGTALRPDERPVWPAPHPDDLVVPAAGFALHAVQRIA